MSDRKAQIASLGYQANAIEYFAAKLASDINTAPEGTDTSLWMVRLAQLTSTLRLVYASINRLTIEDTRQEGRERRSIREITEAKDEV